MTNEVLESKVINYIEEKEKTNGLSDIQENLKNFGLEIKLFKWLKNDEKMLNYAHLFLKENLEGKKRSFIEELKMLSLEVQLKIKCPYFEDFKQFLSELKEEGNIEDDNENNSENDGENNNENTDKDTKDPKDIDSTVETSDIGNKIVEISRQSLKNAKNNLEPKFRHCRGWVDFIYTKAGLLTGSNKRKIIYQDGNKYDFIDTKGKNKTYQLSAIGEQLSNNELIKKIQPGDWLYVHNKNQYDSGGNHSVIFLGRKNGIVGQAETASYPGGTQDAVIKTYDLTKNPIKHITRPVA